MMGVRSLLRTLWTLALLSVLVGASGITAPRAKADDATVTIPVDRQDYVTSFTTKNPVDGSIVDPYNADPSSIHVAVNGGTEMARSFVHLAVDYLPEGATVANATLTLKVTQQSDASNTGAYPIYNINNSTAIIQACVLTTELAPNFDAEHPPAYDCEHGSSVGKQNDAGDTWTFPLENLISYWQAHGNTGAALIPVQSGGESESWAVAFYKSRSSSEATITTTPVASENGGAAAPPSGATPATSGGSINSTPSPAAPPATNGGSPVSPVANSPSVSSPASPPTIAESGSTARHSPRSTWPWVLLACAAVAIGAVGFANRARLGELRTRLVPTTASAFRAHPRSYTVASIAVTWGLVFSIYSVQNEPTDRTTTLAAGRSTTGDSTTRVGTGNGATGTGGAQSTGGATSGTGSAATTASGPADRAQDVAANEFNGSGTTQTISGVKVFFPSDGGPPVADLYHGEDDTIGITDSAITLCAHAALTYGSAFHINASDLNVYWQSVNDQGGVNGRTVNASYQNDNYDPGTAVQAAQACKDAGTFMLLGGIGFDQIPAVRQWAEQNHELYYHHIATTEGSAGLRYSFTPLPSVEQVGTWFGQLAVSQFKGQKIGIIYRQSSNWQPGVDTFEKVVKDAGMEIVGSYGVTINQANYTQELVQLHSAGAQVVFSWENALAQLEMIKQAQGQNWHPAWLINPFNLVTNTLGATAMDQPIWGIGAWDPYDPGYSGGPFAPYANDIKEFEAEYAKYDPSADLAGDGGDLLFLNWEGQRQIADLLQICGPQCSRNKMAGILLSGYHKAVAPNCDVDFSGGDHHHGGYLFSPLQVFKDPNGHVGIQPVARCISQMSG